MTVPAGHWRATYVPGAEIVLSGPTSLVLVQLPPSDEPAMITALWEEVVGSSSMADLATRLASFKIDKLPSFGALFWTDDGMRSLVRGGVTITDLSTGRVVADGAGIQTWTEVGLGALSRCLISAGGNRRDTVGLPLVVGAVRASSVILDATQQALIYSPQLAPSETRELAPSEEVAAAGAAPAGAAIGEVSPAGVAAAEVGPTGVSPAGAAAEVVSSEPVAEPLPEVESAAEPRRAVAMAAPPVPATPAEVGMVGQPTAEMGVVEQPTAEIGMVEQQTAEMDMAEQLEQPAAEPDDERPTAEMPAADAESAASPSTDDQPGAQGEPAAGAVSFEDELEYADTQLMPAPFDAFDPQPFDDAPPAFPQPPVPEPVVPPPPPIPPPPPATAPTPSMPVFAPSPVDPMIMAVECPYGHSNPPEAGTCRICGTQIQPQAPRLVGRPVLAVLFASDGGTAELDRAVLVGRAPDPSKSSFKDPRLLPVQSPGHDISRTHVQVAPDGWQIVVTDLQSTNGTTLIRPGGYDQQLLTPGEPVPVQLGSVLELGDGVSVTIGVPQ
jgi:hypothetical protein